MTTTPTDLQATEATTDKPAIRVLICGGRDWNRHDMTFQLLDRYLQSQPISVVIHGAARGADTLADRWAKSRNIPVMPFPVTSREWQTIGRKAGHIRNQRMLDQGKPDVVIAFPGGPGTRGMMQKARAARVPVVLMS